MWKLAKAKQQLSEVVRRARQQAQVLQNRDEPVAVVVGMRQYEAFKEWQEQRQSQSLADALREAQTIAAEEDYELPVVKRRDRVNAIEPRAYAPHRHKRRK